VDAASRRAADWRVRGRVRARGRDDIGWWRIRSDEGGTTFDGTASLGAFASW